MNRRDIHDEHDFFEYVRLGDAPIPAADRRRIDVALLDMNHSWPNMGHDSLVHIVLELAEEYRETLVAAGMKVRVVSFDVRRALQVPPSPAADAQFGMYVGTGGPGHLDPRLNDGVSEFSQGISETTEWEAPLFRLFDDIVTDADASLFAVCHSFGLMCRWSGVAHPELREVKSSGMPTNLLSQDGVAHPWFGQFANALEDHRHYRVVDNRLFDLVLDSPREFTPVAFENEENTRALTMIEFARDGGGEMPRVFAMNHHPEVIDREHLMCVLNEKRAHGEVSQQWYDERAHLLENEMSGDGEAQSRLTSHFTLLAPMRFQLAKMIRARVDELGVREPAAAAAG
jgi:hypothetical protein